MTVNEMLATIRPIKPISRETLYVYIRKCRIKPLGIRQSPQRYPADSAEKILVKLGLAKAKRTRRNGNGKAKR